MKRGSNSIVRLLLIVAGIVAAVFVAYKVFQYIQMYMMGKAVMGATEEVSSFTHRHK
jgi:hypothetical protein